VILEQKSSGLSVSAFCRKRELSQGSFFRWRRKFTQCDREDAAAKFVPLHLDAPSMTMRPGCEVVLPDGCRIIVPTGSERYIRGVL